MPIITGSVDAEMTTRIAAAAAAITAEGSVNRANREYATSFDGRMREAQMAYNPNSLSAICEVADLANRELPYAQIRILPALDDFHPQYGIEIIVPGPSGGRDVIIILNANPEVFVERIKWAITYFQVISSPVRPEQPQAR